MTRNQLMTPGDKVRRAIRAALREAQGRGVQIGPIADQLKLSSVEAVKLWLTAARYAFAVPTNGVEVDGFDTDWVDHDPNPAAIYVGEDGE